MQELLVSKPAWNSTANRPAILIMAREAAHSSRGSCTSGDATGKAIIRVCTADARAAEHPHVNTATAVDLITFPHHARDPLAVYQPITCHGAYVFDGTDGRCTLPGRVTILATGGLGRIYRYTTNPEGARGDGLAMAYRAGARVINAEYMQFHPTVLPAEGGEGFLISEAVRGEGGRLLDTRRAGVHGGVLPGVEGLGAARRGGARHPPRNGAARIRSRAAWIFPSSRRSSAQARFPNIHAQAAWNRDGHHPPADPGRAGRALFLRRRVDRAWGRTTMPGLYAVGEAACTGLHGANRLASTSLLEGLVWGDRSARDLAGRGELPRVDPDDVPSWTPGISEDADPALIWRDVRTIQYTMWHYVGLIRSAVRLNRALSDLYHLKEEIEDFYRTTRLTDALIGLRQSIQAALVVATAAQHNRQSRGCHYLEDGKQAGIL